MLTAGRSIVAKYVNQCLVVASSADLVFRSGPSVLMTGVCRQSKLGNALMLDFSLVLQLSDTFFKEEQSLPDTNTG